MTVKVRRVDFWPDEWLGGTGGLSDAQCGIYIRACALIYSHGGPITRAELRAACKTRATFRRSLDALVRLGKLVAVDGERLDQVRCEAELDRARRRIEAAQGGARARWDDDAAAPDKPALSVNQTSIKRQSKHRQNGPEMGKTNGLPDAVAYANGQPRTKNKDLESSKGDSALGCASGEDATASPKSVEAVVAETLDVLALNEPGLRNGKYDPVAYGKAVTRNKRDQWLDNLAVFVGERMPGGIPAKMPAWEAIEVVRACADRATTPLAERRAVDALSRMRNSLQYAEAAE